MFAPHPFTESPLLLVSGMGRSGTTVLRNCVAAHPNIESLNRESNYIFDLMRTAHISMDNDFRVKNLVVSKDQFWYQHQQLILNLHWPQKSLSQNPAKPVISTYSMLDPRAALAMLAAFPQISLCYIVRNGIEVVSSYASFKNFQHIEFAQCCRNWASRYDMVQLITHNPHCTLLRYEWLNQQRDLFQTGLTEALQKCGLDFTPHCLGPLETRFHPTRFQGESRTDARDMDKRKDRWKWWSDEQRDQFSEICGSTMRELGYPIPWLTP